MTHKVDQSASQATGGSRSPASSRVSRCVGQTTQGNRPPDTHCRCDSRAQDYLGRKRIVGKSWKEAMRCLKRQLANVVYRQMVADLDEGRLTT